jgi:Leucine-rich repeat (LRR) protein
MEIIGLKNGLSSPVSTWHGIKLGDKVVTINLMDNNLVGQIPSEIVNLPNLQELNLHKNTCQERFLSLWKI